MDNRLPPFAWIGLDDYRALCASVPTGQRNTTLGVYATLALISAQQGDMRHNGGFALSRDEIAATAGVSATTLQRVIVDLETAGLLERTERHDEAGRSLSSAYRLIGANQAPGARTETEAPPLTIGPPDGPPDARACKKEKNKNVSLFTNVQRENARAIKIGGRKVPPDIVARAQAAHAHYCQATGRHRRAFSADGKPASDLTRILARLLEDPEMPTDRVLGVIDNVIANPPGWCDGSVPAIGHIFGPSAWSHSLANDGIVRARHRGRRILEPTPGQRPGLADEMLRDLGIGDQYQRGAAA